MATTVQYQAPQINSSSSKVNYYINGNNNVIFVGVLVTSTIFDEVVSIELYDLNLNLVVNYTIVNETNNTSTVVNNFSDDIRLTQNKRTGALVYAKTNVDANGAITTTYFNMIDGSPYTGDKTELEIYSEAIAATESQIICVTSRIASSDPSGFTTLRKTLTRKDFIDNKNTIVSSLWQDLAGNVVAAPTRDDVLTAGSCELDLDVELIERVDNLLDTNTNKVSGHYVCFAYASFFSKSGDVAMTKALLPDGRTPYNPMGTVSRDPILPEIQQVLTRIDASSPTFSTDECTVSVAIATEYTDKRGNKITVKHPQQNNVVEFNRAGTYQLNYGVSRDADPCLPNIVFTAIGAKSSALVSAQVQPPLVEVIPGTAPVNTGGGVQ